jgi:hypothetical protein
MMVGLRFSWPDLQHKPHSLSHTTTQLLHHTPPFAPNPALLIPTISRNTRPYQPISSFIKSKLTLLQIAKISLSERSLELVVLRQCSPLSALAASKCKKYISLNLNSSAQSLRIVRAVGWWGWMWGSVGIRSGARYGRRKLD